MATAAAVAHRRNRRQASEPPGNALVSLSNKSLSNKVAPEGADNEQGHSFTPEDKEALRRRLLGETPEKRLQRFFRERIFPRLNRGNLGERLVFESQVLKGSGRLFNQVAVFALLMLSLTMSSKHEAKRGIYDDLSSAFKFGELSAIPNRRAFVRDCLPLITAKSKEYFVLSSQYFDPSEQGSVIFERSMRAYVRPVTYRPLFLKSTEMTLSAWVRLSDSFVQGPLFRKRAIVGNADVGCWGWYLHNQNGPSFRYAAHDYFHVDFHDLEQLMTLHDGNYEDVPLGNETFLEPGNTTLLTLVVSAESVSFFRDVTLLGTRALHRPVTDCANNEEGVLVGSNGLEMGMIRYFPWAFAASGVEELYEAGNVLTDISTGSESSPATESEVASAQRQVLSSISLLGDEVSSVKEAAAVTALLQTTGQEQIAARAAKVAARSPAAPTGTVAVNASLVVSDGLTGLSFTQLAKGPYRLTKTTDALARYLTGVPDWSGGGVAFTWWYRHTEGSLEECVASGLCQVYLFTVIDDAHIEDPCYSLMIETDGIRWLPDSTPNAQPPDPAPSAPWHSRRSACCGVPHASLAVGGVGSFGRPLKANLANFRSVGNVKGSPDHVHPKDFIPNRYKPSGDQVWRHMALVLAEATDEIHFYLDGQLAWSGPFGSAVSAADCNGANKRMTLGRKHPGYSHGSEVEIYDLRMYNTAAGANNHMSAAQVAALAAAGASDAAISSTLCHPIEDSRMHDHEWTDSFGNDCAWYFRTKKAHPDLCLYSEAASQCPLSCQTQQECFVPFVHKEVYFSWDRIRRVLPLAENKGTVCLGDGANRTAVVDACYAYYHQDKPVAVTAAPSTVSGGDSYSSSHRRASAATAEVWNDGYRGSKLWYDSMTKYRQGDRVNVTLCGELSEAIDDHCAFDTAQVQNFTRDVKLHHGDFTIAFWIRPVSGKSLTNGKFVPQISFLGSISPPRHNLILGWWETANGEARLNSKCQGTGHHNVENVELHALSSTEWSFIAVTFKNTTNGTASPAKAVVLSNIGESHESFQMPMCLFDDANFFTAIEVNKPVLLSPIMMIPEYLSIAKMQQLYVNMLGDMLPKRGPRRTAGERDTDGLIPITKNDYDYRSGLLAAPVLFQTRVHTSAQCGFHEGTAYIADIHEKVKGQKCSAPYSCDAAMHDVPELTMGCPGEPYQAPTRVLGLDPISFGGDSGYADILYSITDSEFVYRQGEVVSTASFFDSHTATATIILLFFTPSLGITTVVKINGDFSGDLVADMSTSVQHYEVLEGAPLNYYLAVQIINLIFIVIMIFDTAYTLLSMLREWRATKQPPQGGEAVKVFTDICTVLMVTVFVCLRIPSKMASAPEAEAIMHHLTHIPWENTTLHVHDKKEDFFSAVMDLLALIEHEEQLNAFCNAILIVLLFRVVQCTAVHPRLALLTGTLRESFDDLLHATILIVLLLGCFAGIGTWAFGSERPDFGSLEVTMQTLFEMFVGNFPADWTQSPALRAFVVLYLVLIFLLVQNFLLAIIVEAYMNVREAIQTNKVAQSFHSDVYNSFLARCLSWHYGWPDPEELGGVLLEWEAKLNVGFSDLWMTGLFKTQQSVGSFVRHYAQYSFLAPLTVTKYGVLRDDDEQEPLVKRIYHALGRKPPTLKQELENAEDRHERKLRARKEGTAFFSMAPGAFAAGGGTVGGGDAMESTAIQNLAQEVATIHHEQRVMRAHLEAILSHLEAARGGAGAGKGVASSVLPSPVPTLQGSPPQGGPGPGVGDTEADDLLRELDGGSQQI